MSGVDYRNDGYILTVAQYERLGKVFRQFAESSPYGSDVISHYNSGEAILKATGENDRDVKNKWYGNSAIDEEQFNKICWCYVKRIPKYYKNMDKGQYQTCEVLWTDSGRALEPLKDANGELDLTSFVKGLSEEMEAFKLGEKEMKPIFDKMDSNHDGKINFEQFCMVMDHLFGAKVEPSIWERATPEQMKPLLPRQKKSSRR